MNGVVVRQSRPGCLVQLLWFVLVGWWAGQLWITVAWFFAATVIGIPLAVKMFNKLPDIIALRGAEKFLTELCARLGVKPGETTSDGLITIEAVMCLAACDKAPMFQVQSGAGLEYHENQTVESALMLIEQLRADARNRAAFGGRVPSTPPSPVIGRGTGGEGGKQ